MKDVKEKNIKFYIKTYGCQMNFHDSSLLQEGMLIKGFKKAQSIGDANIVILNTCSVRDNADHKIISDIGRISRDKKIVLAGCYAKQKIDLGINTVIKRPLANYYFAPEDILNIPDALACDFIFNNKKISNEKNQNVQREHNEKTLNKENLPNEYEYYEKMAESFYYKSKNVLSSSEFIKITEGCNNFCSYCIVPYVRGEERSIPLNIIVNTIKNYAKQGVSEIILLGQNVNSYISPDNAMHDFYYLLKCVSEIDGIKKIKFLTSHPKDITDEVIKIIASNNKISKCLHLPLQTGSDYILKAMNRGYSRKQYLDITEKIKSQHPDIALSTDIIVGFPGETEEDFEMTISLMKEVEFNFVFGFKYSPRPFTKASQIKDDVPLNIKKERLNRIFEVQKGIFNSILNRLIGKQYDAIIEKVNELNNPDEFKQGFFYKGVTFNDRTVYLTDNKAHKLDILNGDILPVIITKIKNNKIYGELL